MKVINGLACALMGFVFALVLGGIFAPEPPPKLWPKPYVDPLPPQEAAPAVVPVPAQEAKAEDVAGVLETTEAAQADSGVEPPPSVVPPESVPQQDQGGNLARLKIAIEEYRKTNGTRWYVTQGPPEPEHLVQQHGWTYDQLKGLTEDELHLLHGMSHTGRVNPKDFLCGEQPAGGVMPSPAGRPHITIHVAPFHCPACNTMKAYDWSGFDVTYETGGARHGYPEVSWKDQRGWRRSTTGLHTPDQVRAIYNRTME